MLVDPAPDFQALAVAGVETQPISLSAPLPFPTDEDAEREPRQHGKVQRDGHGF
jgi:hypothetical protein